MLDWNGPRCRRPGFTQSVYDIANLYLLSKVLSQCQDFDQKSI